MYQRVLEFITEAHYGQVRKYSGIPYVFHPIEVFTTLANYGVRDEDTLLAALCHDIIEDTTVNYEKLVMVIGTKPADIVMELTQSKDVSKEDYLKSFYEKSSEAIAVKIVDRICNSLAFAQHDHKYAVKYWKHFEQIAIDLLQNCVTIGTLSEGRKLVDNLWQTIHSMKPKD